VFTAFLLIARLLNDRSAEPFIVPTSEAESSSSGTVRSKELEIRVRPNGDVSAFDSTRKQVRDRRSIRSASDLGPLVRLTGDL
jgi:hypothetical protein